MDCLFQTLTLQQVIKRSNLTAVENNLIFINCSVEK